MRQVHIENKPCREEGKIEETWILIRPLPLERVAHGVPVATPANLKIFQGGFF